MRARCARSDDKTGLYGNDRSEKTSPGDESEKLWTKCDNEKVSLDLDCGLAVDQFGL